MATTSGHERPLQVMNDHPDGVLCTDEDLITKVSSIHIVLIHHEGLMQYPYECIVATLAFHVCTTES